MPALAGTLRRTRNSLTEDSSINEGHASVAGNHNLEELEHERNRRTDEVSRHAPSQREAPSGVAGGSVSSANARRTAWPANQHWQVDFDMEKARKKCRSEKIETKGQF